MKSMLVIADPINEKPIAIKRAAELSKKLGYSLHIVHFCYENLRNIDASSKEVQKRILTLVTDKSKKIIGKIVGDEVKHTSEVVWEKYLTKWVNTYVRREQPTLVIKTGHRTETMLYTPTDWTLLRECPAPVLITAQSKIKKSSIVLASVDLGTKLAEKQKLNTAILDYSQRLAKSVGVDLHIVYCPPLSPLLRDLGMQYSDELEIKAEKEFASQLDALASKYKIPRKNIHIKAGEPKKAIPSIAAKYRADILVMGTVGRSKLKGKLIGNTAENILRLMHSDVIAIKPD